MSKLPLILVVALVAGCYAQRFHKKHARRMSSSEETGYSHEDDYSREKGSKNAGMSNEETAYSYEESYYPSYHRPAYRKEYYKDEYEKPVYRKEYYKDEHDYEDYYTRPNYGHPYSSPKPYKPSYSTYKKPYKPSYSTYEKPYKPSYSTYEKPYKPSYSTYEKPSYSPYSSH